MVSSCYICDSELENDGWNIDDFEAAPYWTHTISVDSITVEYHHLCSDNCAQEYLNNNS